MKKIIYVLCIAVLLAMAGTVSADEMAKAVLMDTNGKKVGTVILKETPHGVLISAHINGLEQGTHAFHIHSVGKCEPPFKSAAGHFNPDGKEHGIMNPKGYHAGDMPNVHVGKDGTLEVEVLNTQITLGGGMNGLFDEDGSAVVIHQGPDDYRSDPAGNAGPRIACGVIEK
jgi:Cu-Zn family superoxide dismutase